MVATRQSHTLISQTECGDFDPYHWLTMMNLSQSENDTLLPVLDWCETINNEQPGLLKKGCEMVEILGELSMDVESLVAALVLPIFQEKIVITSQIEKQLGKPIVILLESVDKMDAITSIQNRSGQHSESQLDNIRRMLMTMVEDVRSIVIKLAERICNLRLVKHASEEDKVLVAIETSKVFAPLANRLGIGQLKWEMEDLSFRYLHPLDYKAIAKLLDDRRIEREQYMQNFVSVTQGLLQKHRIVAQVDGRPKHIYSIWKKMDKKNYQFDQLYDIRAVRVITNKLADCYAVLSIIHEHWQHLSSEFSDYIATPKRNGYQSIHTVIFGPEDKTIEVQIRTEQMHNDAELGVAAHWKYKDGALASRSSGYDEKMDWLRKLLQWQEEMAEQVDLTEELKHQVIEDRVYVFTPKGDIFDLPVGSTPLDFAYYIHTMVGHRCIGAKVFERIVPFTYELKTGDKVEILTANQPNPSRDWMNPNMGFLKTHRSRQKVNHWFRQIDRDKHIQSGKEVLEMELGKANLTVKDAEPAIEKFEKSTMDDVFAAIGNGELSVQQVRNFVLSLYKTEQESLIDPRIKPSSGSSHSGRSGQVVIQGVGSLMSHMAKCCHPVVGDFISGYITKGRGIAIHREDCEQFKRLIDEMPARVIDVEWAQCYSGGYSVGIRVIGTLGDEMLKGVTATLTNNKIGVIRLRKQQDNKRQLMLLDLDIEIFSMNDLQRILLKLSEVEGVVEAKRAST